MNIHQIKAKLLRLAVQGKLASQNSSDESAELLFEKIINEKGVKSKKEKLLKIESQVVVPDKWKLVRLGDVITLISGRDLETTLYNEDGEGIPYITGASNIVSDKIQVNRWTQSPSVISIRGDILISCKGTIGLTILNDIGNVHIARQFMSVRVGSFLSREYIKLVLDSNFELIVKSAKSMIPGISRVDILNLLVPLPPFSEQERIVAKIEELFDVCNRFEEKKHSIIALARLSRDKIRELAIQGKLVEQDPTDEPVQLLIKRIEEEKSKAISEGAIKRDKPILGIKATDFPFEIPKEWEWLRLGTIITLISGRDLETDKFNDVQNGIPYITGASNIENSRILINRWTDEPSVISKKGDLLITCKGTIGLTIFNEIGNIHIARQIMAVRFGENVSKSYIKLVVEYYAKHLNETSRSMIPGISREDILNLIIPIPPIEEQNRIVTKSNFIFQICNKLIEYTV